MNYQNWRDIISGTPAILQNVETDWAIGVNIWMEHFRHEPDDGRLIWIFLWKCVVLYFVLLMFGLFKLIMLKSLKLVNPWPALVSHCWCDQSQVWAYVRQSWTVKNNQKMKLSKKNTFYVKKADFVYVKYIIFFLYSSRSCQ